MNKLENLLFGEKVGKDQRPLFSRPIDIVRALLNDSESEFYIPDDAEDREKKFNSTKVYVSKVVNLKMKPSKGFMLSMEKILAERVSDTEVLRDVLNDFESILTGDDEIFNAINTESEVEELNRRYGKSRSQIIFISRPVETYDNSRAIKFLDAIINSLFKFENGIPFIEENEISYEFHFATRLIAYEFFHKLFDRVDKKVTGENSKAIVQELFEKNIDKFLEIYEVDELFVTLPCALFNATRQDASGFVFFSHDSNRFSIAKMTDAAMNRWYKNLYLRAKFTRRRIRFEHYLKVVIDNKSGQDIDYEPILPLEQHEQ